MKKSMLTKTLAILLSLTMMMALSACGGGSGASGDGSGSGTYTWRLAHEENDGELEDIFADFLAERLKENSDGKINLQVFTVGTLGDSSDLFELTQTGTCEFGISNPGAAATIIPEANIFSLHYFFPTDEEEFDTLVESDSQGFARLNELYAAQGVNVLQWGAELPNAWTANKTITSPSDFSGVKFRTMAASVIADSYAAYGANPVAISYTELYSSLQLGMCDGQVNPISAVYASGFAEVQDYLMLSYPDVFIYTLAANSNFWSTLPDDVKAIVTQSIAEAYDLYKEKRAEEEARWLEELSGMIEIIEFTDEMRAPFKEISEQNRHVYTDLAGDSGAELMALFQEDLAALD